jgi:hypothetical protein
MTHVVSGFVARADVLRAHSAHLRSAYVASLEQGFGLLIVTGEVYEETGATAAYEHLHWLTDELARLGAEMSRGGAAAYVETHYFGGLGDQAAVAWADGRIALGPERSPFGPVEDARRPVGAVDGLLRWIGAASGPPSTFGPASAALRRIGARKGGAFDEFEALGLRRHRGIYSWMEQAMAEAPPGDEDRRARIAGARAVVDADGRSTPFYRMADHRVAGFIAPMEVLRRGTAETRSADFARLVRGLGFLPVTDELAEAAGGGGRAYDSLERLTDGLARLGARLSEMDGVIYVETDYHGGAGEQAAMAWHDGAVVSAPVRARDGAIGRVLAWVGVEGGGHYDEVEALGLDRHRDNDAWVSQGQAEVSGGGG